MREFCDFIKWNKYIVRFVDLIMFIFILVLIIFIFVIVWFMFVENMLLSVCIVFLLGNFMVVRKFI